MRTTRASTLYGKVHRHLQGIKACQGRQQQVDPAEEASAESLGPGQRIPPFLAEGGRGPEGTHRRSAPSLDLGRSVVVVEVAVADQDQSECLRTDAGFFRRSRYLLRTARGPGSIRIVPPGPCSR